MWCTSLEFGICKFFTVSQGLLQVPIVDFVSVLLLVFEEVHGML